MKLKWDTKVKQQIADAYAYGKYSFGEQVANKFKENIMLKTKLLKTFPQMGMIEPSLEGNQIVYRYILEASYKIIYSIEGDLIRIHIFWNCRQEPNDLAEQL